MKLKTLPFLISLCLLCPSVFAQKRHTLEVGIGRYDFHNVSQLKDKIGTVSGRYKFGITPKIGIGIAYTRLPVNSGILSAEGNPTDSGTLNKLVYRGKYSYFDLFLSYNVARWKNHSLLVCVGPSLAKGENAYLKELILIPGGWSGSGEPIHIRMESKKESYLGIFSALSYNYIFWKNRINIGADVAARYYTKSFPFQFNYGIHLGYNF